MPDANDILESVATDVEAGIQSSQVAGQSVEMMDPMKRLEAAKEIAAETAAANPRSRFGMRMLKTIPPGCG